MKGQVQQHFKKQQSLENFTAYRAEDTLQYIVRHTGLSKSQNWTACYMSAHE